MKRVAALPFVCCLALIFSGVISAPVHAADGPELADRVVVNKSARWLRLYSGDEVMREFPIALGVEPEGDKFEEGDNKTPEGAYSLEERNTQSAYFLSIRISYPSGVDQQQAQARGVSPGGQIMIHGQPNVPKYTPAFYARNDWTNGCIAVSNVAMIDIWLMTAPGTPIEILP